MAKTNSRNMMVKAIPGELQEGYLMIYIITINASIFHLVFFNIIREDKQLHELLKIYLIQSGFEQKNHYLK